jgi:uncharacterized membrane protein YcgQ (UPF0703/DUF1980 family)
MKAILCGVLCLLLLVTGCGVSNVPSFTPSLQGQTLPDAAVVPTATPLPSASPQHIITGEDAEPVEGVDIVIGEKLFIAQINDIYLNTEDYLGKSIQLEGIFEKVKDPATGSEYSFVYRFGPGCCVNDSYAPLEVVAWDDYPDNYEWVKATGTLVLDESTENPVPVLELSALDVQAVRGEEYVTS